MRAEADQVRLRDLVRALNYVVSIHASQELDDENLTILDLENIILTGEIVERQRDRQTGEVKCVIRGLTLDDREAESVVKVGPTGKLVVITVYLLQRTLRLMWASWDSAS